MSLNSSTEPFGYAGRWVDGTPGQESFLYESGMFPAGFKLGHYDGSGWVEVPIDLPRPSYWGGIFSPELAPMYVSVSLPDGSAVLTGHADLDPSEVSMYPPRMRLCS